MGAKGSQGGGLGPGTLNLAMGSQGGGLQPGTLSLTMGSQGGVALKTSTERPN